MDDIGGPGFESIKAGPVSRREFPAYLPRIRPRAALRGQLDEPIYAVSIADVLRSRSRVLSADRLREIVGLTSSQEIVLMLFGHDRHLERVWGERGRLLPGIADAGYNDVVGPSYSVWSPRPRTEFMFNVKRSLVIFEGLQELEVPVIPRVAWQIHFDVRRWARWLEANPVIETVALDLGTYNLRTELQFQLEGLAALDHLTANRLSYLVNGLTTVERVLAAYQAVLPARLSITNGRAIARPANGDADFGERCATERRIVEEARGSLGTAPTSTERRIARAPGQWPTHKRRAMPWEDFVSPGNAGKSAPNGRLMEFEPV